MKGYLLSVRVRRGRGGRGCSRETWMECDVGGGGGTVHVAASGRYVRYTLQTCLAVGGCNSFLTRNCRQVWIYQEF